MLGAPEGDDGGSTGIVSSDTSGTTADDAGSDDSFGGTLNIDPCEVEGIDCVGKLDLLFVIDNSGTMGEEQLNLAQNFPLLIDELRKITGSEDDPVSADVNIMVTTTDFDAAHAACFPYAEGYQPAKGAPIHSPCTQRLDRFTGLGPSPLVVEEACLDVCSMGAPAVPTDPFIHFDSEGSNVVGGMPEGDPADALACLGPQGIDGCGFESPLESMMQALDPNKCWNAPEACDEVEWSWVTRPFLRPDAVLAIVVITDEVDCSIKVHDILGMAEHWEINPQSGLPERSSALCWNKGVECDGPDAEGVYGNCHAKDDGVLQPTARYIDYLVGDLREQQGKEVIMLGILGVPEVTAHNPEPPFEPTEGGVFDLEVRQWREGMHPDGDIPPDEFIDGKRAEDKTWEFGVGPGCTATTPGGEFLGQAIPPVRIREVCESLDIPDDPDTPQDESRVRCCIESICDDDFSPAIACLTDLVRDVFRPIE